MRKKELELWLQKVPPHPSPTPMLEQYTTPAPIAADVLFNAYLDIKDKKIVDLGCGTGIFSIGAKLLGAAEVYGVDVDVKAIKVARNFARKLGLGLKYVVKDVKNFTIHCNTVFQNPPFGAQVRAQDRIFLQKSLEIGEVVYTIHLSVTRRFVESFVKQLGGKVTHTKNYKFPIPHMFKFHRKKRKLFDVTMFRVTK